MKRIRNILAVCALPLLGVAACADLEVLNPNAAGAERALQDASDVEALIGGAYHSWYTGNHHWGGAGAFLSNASFHHTAPWANFGMEEYARIPRIPVVNESSHGLYTAFTRNWTYSYRALAAVAEGLQALQETPDFVNELGESRVRRAEAFGRLVQGLGHAQLALLYDQAWITDETTDIFSPGEPIGYGELIDVAMGYMDQAISIAEQGLDDLPTGWMQRSDVGADEFIRFVRSMKARYRASVPRTPEERAAVDWAQVVADADAGITEDFIFEADNSVGFGSVILYYNQPGWAEIPYFIWGMADQSDNYQRWLDVPMADKHPIVDGDPTLIITPDTRFPQGATLEEQQANDGKYFAAPTDINSVWAQPGRGTWRWSYYRHIKNVHYTGSFVGPLAEITVRELQLLKAEGLFRMGDLAGAAEIINETRVDNGLNATDAAGTNTSCVPKLPNGDCGDLFEMLKWEKRLETSQSGPVTVAMYFDSRGWGDLWRGTTLQFPMPCQDAEILGLLPCYTFGGVDGDRASPGSSYNFPHEN